MILLKKIHETFNVFFYKSSKKTFQIREADFAGKRERIQSGTDETELT